MVGPDGSHPDLSDFRPSGLTMDPASNPLLDLHLGTDLALDAHSHPSFLTQWSSSEPQDFYYLNYPPRLANDQDAWNPVQVTGVPHSSSVSHMNAPPVGDSDCAFPKPHYSTPSESGSQYKGSFHSADSGYGSAGCATHSIVASSYTVDSTSSPQIAAQEPGLGESVAFLDQPHVGAESMFTGDISEMQSFDTVVKCDHPTCSWMGKCPSDKRYAADWGLRFVFSSSFAIYRLRETSLTCVGNTRHGIGNPSNAMNLIALVKRASEQSMTSLVTKSVCIIKSPSAGRRCRIYVSARVVLARTKSGHAWIISSSI